LPINKTVIFFRGANKFNPKSLAVFTKPAKNIQIVLDKIRE